MGKVVLEFQRQQGAPRIVPVNGTLSPDRLNPPMPEEPRSIARGNKSATETNTEVLAVQAVAEAQGQALAQRLPPATMVWGRWTSSPLPGDSLGVPYAEARAGRSVTVGNEYFALYRPESPLPALVSNLGRVDFTLRDAQVYLLRSGLAELGRVDNAWLTVDFGARQFATGIGMSHPAVGAASLQVGGALRDDGMFAVQTPSGSVLAGALTVDGKEAGYFFQQPVTAVTGGTGTGGAFMGITRWGR
jgi:hypothetical protein